MRRKVGVVLLGSGIVVILWVAVLLVWGDPVTSLYTIREQRQLAAQLDRVDKRLARVDKRLAAARPPRHKAETPQDATRALRARARVFQRQLHDGDPIGRIHIPKIHLDAVVLQGTTTSDLEKGPGHYDAASGVNTALPGLGHVIAIAGHRTTFLHPFRHIDDLRSGDNIYLEMPYGTFRYTVYYQKVVLPNDWSILRSRPYEKLVLTACHPLYSASHRLAVFARLAGASARAPASAS